MTDQKRDESKDVIKAERKHIANWLRMTPTARGVLININSSGDIARLANDIENGEHEKRRRGNMINISQDPARRIRRIQRLGDKPAEEYMEFIAPTPGEFERAELPSQFKIRVLRGNRLAKRYRLASEEREWLCVHSHHQSVTIAEQKARIELLEAKLDRAIDDHCD